jgi:hypothetical protein
MKKIVFIIYLITSSSLFASDDMYKKIGKVVSSTVDSHGYKHETRIASVYVDKYGKKRYNYQSFKTDRITIPKKQRWRYNKCSDKARIISYYHKGKRYYTYYNK